MKPVNIIFILILLMISQYALPQATKEPLVVGYLEKFESEILGVEKELYVSLPKDYEKEEETYPLVLFLDARGNYQVTFDALDKLVYSKMHEKAIVIGIQPKNRNHHYLPTATNRVKNGGGAEQYLSFINKELLPFLEKEYRTSGSRTLLGTSFGGVFVLYALLTEPESFTSYLAISPSCWYDDSWLIKRAKEVFPKDTDLSSKNLFISLANEGEKMGVDAFVKVLKEQKSGLNWEYANYPNETHASTVYKATWDGFKYLGKKK